MKKLIAAALAAMMLAPTGVQAKGTKMKVVSKIGKDKVTYNQDGLITKNGDTSIKYKNGKISSINCWDTMGKSYTVTYSHGRVATINNQKVSIAYNKKMKYNDENMKNRTTPKGTYYTFKQTGVFKDEDAQYLMNKKGQLLASYIGYTTSYYKYDRKGYANKWMTFDGTSGIGASVYTVKNKYKGSSLVSRSGYVVFEEKDKYNVKYTYKTIRVRNVSAVKKQQQVLLNSPSTLAYIFVQ